MDYSFDADLAVCVSGCLHLNALTPPIIPKMKPIMNPPPVITLGIENIITIAPQTFLFKVPARSIIAPNNTNAPHVNPMAAMLVNGTAALLSDPGSVGKIQGNHVPATPTAIALQTINIPATRDHVKPFVGFSLWLKIYITLKTLWLFTAMLYGSVS